MTRDARCAVATALALAIAACARTPAAPGAKVWTATPHPNAIDAVAFGGDVVYALTQGRRVRVWTGDAQPIRTLDLEHVLALAQDGSVAVTAAKEGKYGDRLQVWALPAATPVYARSFEHGVAKVLAVSAKAAALLVNTADATDPNEGVPQMPPQQSYGQFWSFAGDRNDLLGRIDRCDEHATFSTDARRFVCQHEFGTVSWLDLESGRPASPELAPDWLPPAPAPRSDTEELLTERTRPGVFEFPPYFVLSLRLSANGDDVYVAYSRMRTDDEGLPARPHEAWRLERWTAATTSGPGPIVLLAATDAAYTRLLAISGDGGLAVLGSQREPLVVRRAPRYEAERLAAESATAAAVSGDGERIVSGHADGRLRLWEARSGRLLATAGP